MTSTCSLNVISSLIMFPNSSAALCKVKRFYNCLTVLCDHFFQLYLKWLFSYWFTNINCAICQSVQKNLAVSQLYFYSTHTFVSARCVTCVLEFLEAR